MGLTKPYPHEAPFRPANPPKKGVTPKPVVQGEMRDYLGGTYEYIGDPEVKTQRKPKSDEPEKAPFKGCVPGKFANPMPSVVCNTHNMRRERPSSFTRRYWGGRDRLCAFIANCLFCVRARRRQHSSPVSSVFTFVVRRDSSC